jgi:hypothetical protein
MGKPFGMQIKRATVRKGSAFFKEFKGGGETGKKGRTKNMSRRGLANARV